MTNRVAYSRRKTFTRASSRRCNWPHSSATNILSETDAAAGDAGVRELRLRATPTCQGRPFACTEAVHTRRHHARRTCSDERTPPHDRPCRSPQRTFARKRPPNGPLTSVRRTSCTSTLRKHLSQSEPCCILSNHLHAASLRSQTGGGFGRVPVRFGTRPHAGIERYLTSATASYAPTRSLRLPGLWYLGAGPYASLHASSVPPGDPFHASP